MVQTVASDDGCRSYVKRFSLFAVIGGDVRGLWRVRVRPIEAVNGLRAAGSVFWGFAPGGGAL
jgi:hypothetical protein